MKIGILGAMPEEIEGIKQFFTKPPHQFLGTTKLAGRDYHQFRAGKHEIVLVFSRWGKVASSVSASTLANHFKVDAIIFSGVAGAAHTELSVGDIVIGNKMIQHDMNAFPLFPKFQIPLTDVTYFNAHPLLVKLATQAVTEVVAGQDIVSLPVKEFNPKPLKVFSGTLASGDQFIADKTKVMQLAKEIDNLYAVDMESAAVAQVCHDYELPFVAIRVISDKADGTAHIDFPKFTARLASPLDALIVEKLVVLLPDHF